MCPSPGLTRDRKKAELCLLGASDFRHSDFFRHSALVIRVSIMSVRIGMEPTWRSRAGSRRKAALIAPSAELDLLRELWAKLRRVQETCGSRTPKAHRARRRAEPDFPGARIEIKRRFLMHIRFGVVGRKDFDANLRRFWKTDVMTQLAHAFGRRPRYVGCFDTVRSRDGTFGKSSTVRH